MLESLKKFSIFLQTCGNPAFIVVYFNAFVIYVFVYKLLPANDVSYLSFSILFAPRPNESLLVLQTAAGQEKVHFMRKIPNLHMVLQSH